jgi:hypothetical protein
MIKTRSGRINPLPINLIFDFCFETNLINCNPDLEPVKPRAT